MHAEEGARGEEPGEAGEPSAADRPARRRRRRRAEPVAGPPATPVPGGEGEARGAADGAEAAGDADGGAAPRRRRTRRRGGRSRREGAAAEGPAGGGGDEASEGAPPADTEAEAGEGTTPARRRRRTRRGRRGAAEAQAADEGTPAGEEAAAEGEGAGRRRRRRRGARAGDAAAAAEVGAEGAEAAGEDEETAGGERRRRARKERRPRVGQGRRRAREAEDVDEDEGEAEEVAAAEPEVGAKAVEKVLLINAVDTEEVRIALLEDGRVEELYVEVVEERSSSGNIYLGRVQNVEKGIGAAFVDLGRGLTGFLHVSDLPDRPAGAVVTELLQPGQRVLVQITRDSIGRKGPALTGRIALPGRYLVLMPRTPRSGVSRRILRGRTRERVRRHLEKLEVPEGMGIIVRTAGLTATYEDLARDLGHLVQAWHELEALAEKATSPGLLRAESDLAERSVRDIMPPDTARVIVDRKDLADRIEEILAVWYDRGEAVRHAEDEAPSPDADAAPTLPDGGAAPAEEAPSAAEVQEDEPTPEVPPPAPADGEDAPTGDPAPGDALPEPAAPSPDAPEGDAEDAAAEALREERRLRGPRVEFHDSPMPLFHGFGVEPQLEEAFRRQLRLPSGGSIVIDPTEALVAVDVNSGRSTAEEDPSATALSTNLEAATEVARQLRLRDLGGLVVVDFIDMRERRSDRKVERALKTALGRDRARVRVGRIGAFGCLILSRQRIRQALSRVTHEECDACGGTGRRRHPAGLGLRVVREMQARVARSRGRGGLHVRVPQPVLDWILRYRRGLVREIEGASSGPVRIEADDRLPMDAWAMKGLPPAGRPGGAAPEAPGP